MDRDPIPGRARTADSLLTELRKLEQQSHALTVKTRDLRRAHFGPQPESGDATSDKDTPTWFLPQAFGSVAEISAMLAAAHRDLDDLKESHGARTDNGPVESRHSRINDGG